LSKKSVAGTYEVEVLLGSQEVCLLELDLPEAKSELRSVKLDTPVGQEYFRGLLSGIFTIKGQEEDVRQLQVYDLFEGISTLREAVEAGESNDKLKAKLTPSAQDEVAQSCIQHFLFLADQLNKDKFLQALSTFSKFLHTKKESLPKVNTQPKPSTPRWDRVAKSPVVIATDEPTQEIEVNALEEGMSEDSETVETEWHDDEVGGAEEVETEELEEESEDIP
jgi:hypothetical protein